MSSAPEPSDQGWPTGHVDFVATSLDRFSDWIRFADAKAGAVLVVIGVALADLLERAGALTSAATATSRWGAVATIAFWAGGGLAVATTVSVMAALFPSVKPGEASEAHFGHVAEAESPTAYRQTLRGLSESQLADHVAAQAWDLARIATAKFARIRLAYLFALGYLITWAVARLALAWSS
ncbi:MAG: Pycsar system effector family protein [Acidimicrobiia bacterium]